MTAYGLSDASRIWYLKVKRELQQFGVNTNKYDEAILFWRHDNDLHGILCSRVVDFFWRASQLFKTNVRSNQKIVLSQPGGIQCLYLYWARNQG